jgi:hypothetical protein
LLTQREVLDRQPGSRHEHCPETHNDNLKNAHARTCCLPAENCAF